MSNLNEPEIHLLTEIVGARKSCLEPVVARAVAGSITPEEREALRLVLLDEFLDELDSHDEPSPRGVAVDALIGGLTKVAPLQDQDVNERRVEQILDC